MSRGRRAFRVAMLLSVALAAGCALFASAPEPVPASVVAVPGERFPIELAANRTTGFEWRLGSPLDEKVVTLVEKRYETAPEGEGQVTHGTQVGKVGAGGREVWTFEAVGPGWTRIQFAYARPWEEDLAPAKIAVYSVNVRAAEPEPDAGG